MDVDGLVELHAGFEILAEGDGVALGVGGGVFATAAAGAGDDAAGDGGGPVVESGGDDRGGGGVQHVVRDAGDDEVLPNGEADLAAAVAVGDVGDVIHLLAGHAADRSEHAEVVFAVVLRMDAEVAVLGFRQGRLAEFQREMAEGEGHLLRGFLERFRDSPVIDEIFEAGFFAVGAVAVFDEDAHQGGGDGNRLGGSEQHAAVCGELLVAGDAAELHAEIDARPDALVVRSDFHRVEADVVGVGAGGNGTAGIVGDVELARQAVEVAVFQDVVVNGAGVGHHVDQLVGIEAGGRRGGDVADIVGTGALRGQAEIGEFHQHGRAVLRHDFADLEIGSGG